MSSKGNFAEQRGSPMRQSPLYLFYWDMQPGYCAGAGVELEGWNSWLIVSEIFLTRQSEVSRIAYSIVSSAKSRMIMYSWAILSLNYTVNQLTFRANYAYSNIFLCIFYKEMYNCDAYIVSQLYIVRKKNIHCTYKTHQTFHLVSHSSGVECT